MLQTVLETEPERLLPLMTVEQHRVLGFITAYLRPLLEPRQAAGRVRSGVDLDAAADYVARMVLSLIGSARALGPHRSGRVRRLVRTELLGGSCHAVPARGRDRRA